VIRLTTTRSTFAEFNELFLERIAEGLDLTSNLTASKNNSQMIKKYGCVVADGGPGECTR
jgi:hypothetical protein